MSLAVHQGGRHCASIVVYDENGNQFPIPTTATVTMTIFKSRDNRCVMVDQPIVDTDEDNDWSHGKIARVLTGAETMNLEPGVYGISVIITIDGEPYKTRDVFVFEVIKAEA